jgi:hypothetical protein
MSADYIHGVAHATAIWCFILSVGNLIWFIKWRRMSERFLAQAERFRELHRMFAEQEQRVHELGQKYRLTYGEDD